MKKNYSEFINENQVTFSDFSVAKGSLERLLYIEFEEYDADEQVQFIYKKPYPGLDEDRVAKDSYGNICYDFKFIINDPLIEDIRNKLTKFAKKYELELTEGNSEYLTGPYTSILFRFKTIDIKLLINEIS
jgi:hypothetical protein